MKKKRFTFMMMLLVVLTMVVTACSTKSQSDDKKEEKTDLLQDIKEGGTIKIGLMGTYQPYNFLNENKEMDGYDADVAKELAKRMGVEVEFVAQEFSGMIAGLQTEKFDAVISQMTITDERKEQMDFTEPYIKNNVKVIVQEDNTSITSKEDFVGKEIGVGLGTNDETYLRTVLIPEVGEFNIRTYDDVITTLKDLDAGRIDATINNLYAIKPVIEKNGYKIKAVGDAIKSDFAGVAIRKGNETLLKELDKHLAEMKEDGTLSEIHVKWFGEEPQF